MPIRVVCQDSPTFYRFLGGTFEPDECPATMSMRGVTYYRAETHDHYVLYRAALSGWGAAAPNPMDPRPVFDPAQR